MLASLQSIFCKKSNIFAPFYGYFYVDKYVNWYFRNIDKWFHCKFNRKKDNIFIVLFFIENANSMGIALNTNRNFYISILLTKNVSIYIYWYIYIDIKILNVDLYTQTLLWFVTSCTNCLEIFSLWGWICYFQPNETIIWRQFE